MAGFTLRDSPEFDDWRAARAATVERTIARVLDRLSAALEANGDVAAIAAAGRRIDLDPLDELAHVRRMELLAAAGDRAGAVRQYRACVAVLERELGVDRWRRRLPATKPSVTGRCLQFRSPPRLTPIRRQSRHSTRSACRSSGGMRPFARSMPSGVAL